MSKNTNEAGFGAVEAVLVLVILTLIGTVGFTVYRYHAKKVMDTSASTTSATKAETKTATQAPDQYAGWKSYCDTAKNCFRYPSDWTPITSGPAGPEAGNFVNPQKTLKLISGADNSNGNLSDPAVWHTHTLKSLANANEKYRVWGGYLAAPGVYIPQFAVVDASKVGSAGLAIGKTRATTDDTYISYMGSSSSQRYSLTVFAQSNSGFTGPMADRWFDSVDAQTALLIVRSYYNQ